MTGPSSDAGKAILGSPNGRGVSFFLYQHKSILDVKTVESVTVFSTVGQNPSDNSNEAWYQAIFNLINV
jgi:hypothetical protein